MIAIHRQPYHPLAEHGFQKIILISAVLLVGVVIWPPDAAEIATADNYIPTLGGFEVG